MSEAKPVSRAVLKLSGEVLRSDSGPLDEGALVFFAREIAAARSEGTQLAVVPGGGNVARGSALPHLPAHAGHTIGMLSTLINAVALREALADQGVPTVLQSAVPCPGIAGPVDVWAGREALADGQVLLLAGGTGSPFVTTDTAAVIRALALEAELVAKGSKVGGIYDSDPNDNVRAVPIARLTHADYLSRGLKVMDAAAVSIAGEHNLPLIVFKATEPGTLVGAICGRTGSRIG
ncbi:MAG: UMP kinase [Candidatus Bipolaricaulota bacterium]